MIFGKYFKVLLDNMEYEYVVWRVSTPQDSETTLIGT
jgi:hypothetical protein